VTAVSLDTADAIVIFSFGVGRSCDLRRRVADIVVDAMAVVWRGVRCGARSLPDRVPGQLADR
jgi:hypothetical protein